MRIKVNLVFSDALDEKLLENASVDGFSNISGCMYRCSLSMLLWSPVCSLVGKKIVKIC